VATVAWPGWAGPWPRRRSMGRNEWAGWENGLACRMEGGRERIRIFLFLFLKHFSKFIFLKVFETF
jgi:hypothetical protein